MQLSYWRIGLRGKTLLGIVVPIAVLYLLLTVANERYLTAKITKSYRADTESTVRSFVTGFAGFKDSGASNESKYLIRLRRSNPLYEQVVLFVSTGHGLAPAAGSQSKRGLVQPVKFYETALGANESVFRERDQKLEVAVPVVFKDSSTGVLAVKLSLAERDRLIHELRDRNMVLIGFGLLVLSLAYFVGINHVLLMPLKKLQLATTSVDQDCFKAPGAVRRHDELGELARAIKDMTEYLQRHSSALERRVGELTILHNMSKVASSAVGLNEALETMLESAVKAIQATSGFIMLNERLGGNGRIKLQLKTSIGIPDGPAGEALVNRDIAQFVADRGEPLLLIGDITRLGFRQHREFKDAVLAPIKLNEEVVGVVGLTNKQTGNFTKKDLQLLLTLANQATGIIQRVKLFEDLQESYFSTIQALAAAIDAKDPYARGHSSRVVKYTQLIASRLDVSEEEVKALKIAAYLHDIGKISIDKHILLKPIELTPSEYEIVKKHSLISARILARVSFLKDTIPIVRHHHEDFNGGGYPSGLKGANIPLGSRILSVADSFDAMTTDRPYRRAIGRNQALEELKRCSGSQFDPDIVDVFFKHGAEMQSAGNEPVASFFI